MHAAVVKRRQQLGASSVVNENRSIRTKEKDDELLALFMEMKQSEKARDDLLDYSHDYFSTSTDSKPFALPVFDIVAPIRKSGADDFLNSENNKGDYEWLMTPPGTPLFPSLRAESLRSIFFQLDTPDPRLPSLKSSAAEPISTRSDLPGKRPPAANSRSQGLRRPSSSDGAASRPSSNKPTRSSTPTARHTIPSKATLSASRPSPPATTSKVASPAIRATPKVHSTPPKSAPTSSRTPPAAPRSTTPVRSAPKIGASSLPNPKSAPRSSIPARTTPESTPKVLSVPKQSRGRTVAPSCRSSSSEGAASARARRQSSSPSRGRIANGVHACGGSVPALSRLHAKANENISPVVVGTKMVERVINMRKLAPPKPEDKLSPNVSGKLSSPDSAGFGRTISKKSLDMAIRHMDIRRALPGSLRTLTARVPASSVYSVRAGPPPARTSGPPAASNSNNRSDVGGLWADNAEVEEAIFSDRAARKYANP